MNWSHPSLRPMGKKQHAALHSDKTNIWGNSTVSLHLRENKESLPVSITQVQGHATTALAEGTNHTQSSNSNHFPSFIVTSSRQIRSERNSQAAQFKKKKKKKPQKRKN